jgi:hypothetical protein
MGSGAPLLPVATPMAGRLLRLLLLLSTSAALQSFGPGGSAPARARQQRQQQRRQQQQQQYGQMVAPSPRQLSEVGSVLCIDVLAEQCNVLVEELTCDGLFTGNLSGAQTLVSDVCFSSCTGCPCFNAYDDNSVEEEAQGAPSATGTQLAGNSSEAGETGEAAGTDDTSSTRSPCNALIAQGTYSCASHFCTSCDFAGLCDLSCEFCKENDEPTPVCTNPYDDFQGPGACDTQISSGHMTCDEDFCETCTYAGFCVLSCGGCGASSGNTDGADGTNSAALEPLVSSSSSSPPVPVSPESNSSVAQAAEEESADSWCLWFGAGLSNTKYCAHPLLWVSILPMTGALCGLILGCCLGCRAPPRMRKRMPTEIVGIRDMDIDGDDIGGLEERAGGTAAQTWGGSSGAADGGASAQHDGMRRSDKPDLRTSGGRRASFASSASSSSVFTQSSSRVKHSRTRKWVQQNTANPVAADIEGTGSGSELGAGGRRRSGMVLRPEHAFDLETPPPSPPNELMDDEDGMAEADSVGTPTPLQLTAEDFLAVIDEMTDQEVAQSCRELGLLAGVKHPRQHQLRQALRAHYAGDSEASQGPAPAPASAAAQVKQQQQQQQQQPPPPPQQQQQRRRHQPPSLQSPPSLQHPPQRRGDSGGGGGRAPRRDPPPPLAYDDERQGQQGQGQGHSRPPQPVRRSSQWIL